MTRDADIDRLRPSVEPPCPDCQRLGVLCGAHTMFRDVKASLRADTPSVEPEEAGLRQALMARHEKVCLCPFDGTDPGCNLQISGTWLGAMLQASPAANGMTEPALPTQASDSPEKP